MKTNILVDASITKNEDWYDIIPLNISIDGKDLEDKNEPTNRSKILKSKNVKTSFYAPEKVKNMLEAKNVIFTVPESLSGQFLSYKAVLEDENTIVIDGSFFYTHAHEIKIIIESSKTLQQIADKVDDLNHSIKYFGILTTLNDVPSRGRMNTMIKGISNILKLKVLLKFQDKKWKKTKILKNVSKTIKKIIENEKEVLFIFNMTNKIIQDYIDRAIRDFPNLIVKKTNMSNAMISHVGEGFLTIVPLKQQNINS